MKRKLKRMSKKKNKKLQNNRNRYKIGDQLQEIYIIHVVRQNSLWEECKVMDINLLHSIIVNKINIVILTIQIIIVILGLSIDTYNQIIIRNKHRLIIIHKLPTLDFIRQINYHTKILMNINGIEKNLKK